MNFDEARHLQSAFDKEYWQLNNDEFAKIRHIAFHLANLMGKIGRYCERREHGEHPEPNAITREVIPDLIIYALQLSNVFDVDISEAYQARLEDNRRRNRPLE